MASYDILSIAKQYIRTIEERAEGDHISQFFHTDAIQIEFPNRLTVNSATRTLADIKAGSEKGKQVLRSENYDIKNELVQGNTVVLELLWTGILAIPIASLLPGDAMKAHFATFIEFKDDKIIQQRNYDCFEPF